MKKPNGLAKEHLAGSYMLQALTDCGGSKIVPNLGETALDWCDVVAYHQATGELPTPYERRLLRDLSISFVEGKYEGRNPLSINPAERDEELH